MTLSILLKLENTKKSPLIENRDSIMNTLKKKYSSKPVSEKYNEHGEIIERKNLSIVTVQPSPKSSSKINPSLQPEVKLMDLKSPNSKNLSIVTNFIIKRMSKIHLNNQINCNNIRSNPVKVTIHQIMDKKNNNLLQEKIDLLVKRSLMRREKWKKIFLTIRK